MAILIVVALPLSFETSSLARADQIASILGLAFAVLGLGAALLSFASGLRQGKIFQQAARQPSLADRIELLRANLSASSSLIDEINAEMHVQTTALDRIRAEAEENRRLAAFHQDEAEAVRQLVETTIQQAQGVSTSQSKRQQWLFFLAGLFFAIPLGVAGNFIYSLLIR